MIRKRRGAIPRRNLQARSVVYTVDKFNRPTTPTYNLFTLENCTIQPYVGEDFLVAGEGFQNKKAFTIFTDTSVSVGEEDSNIKPDQVYVMDGWYRVVKVKPWLNNVISHYEIVVVKITGQSP